MVDDEWAILAEWPAKDVKLDIFWGIEAERSLQDMGTPFWFCIGVDECYPNFRRPRLAVSWKTSDHGNGIRKSRDMWVPSRFEPSSAGSVWDEEEGALQRRTIERKENVSDSVCRSAVFTKGFGYVFNSAPAEYQGQGKSGQERSLKEATVSTMKEQVKLST